MARRKASTVADVFDLSLEGKKPFRPINAAQADYLRGIRTSEMVIGTGPAGSGKTYVAAAHAAELLATKEIDKVILSRPLVTIDDEQIGFLPGKIENKMEPWTAPIFDVFRERLGAERTHMLLKEQRIQIIPFGFMRGRTFKDALVLIDEAQNMSPNQAKALVTRIGDNCTYCINGDLSQSDRKGPNGLALLLDMIDRHDMPIPIIEFSERDVVRSPMCKMWVKAFKADDHPVGLPALQEFLTRTYN